MKEPLDPFKDSLPEVEEPLLPAALIAEESLRATSSPLMGRRAGRGVAANSLTMSCGISPRFRLWCLLLLLLFFGADGSI